MANTNIYQDIAARTGGDIYIGVVGPVRTGKSTFIKKFMETLVIPNIKNEYDRTRAKDEMPQSAAGKTVMTTEPKFIPDDAVEVTLEGGSALRVKMIDCVGYIVPEALGNLEGDKPRMVMTPWSGESIPFDKAAEIGTRKVIRDHSTIGVLVTCDGSFGELPRENYVESEARIAAELHEIQKPFVIVLNSAHPESEESAALAMTLEQRYHAPVALVSCLELDKNDIRHILELVLLEFPVTELSVELPDFMNALDRAHPIHRSVYDTISSCAAEITKTGDIGRCFASATENAYVKEVRVERIDLGCGKATVRIELADGLFYGLIGELSGFVIDDDEALMKLLLELSDVKKQYDKVKGALEEVNATGYGIVVPDIYDMKLEEPQMVKQTGGYGVKLRASAPSIHMIKADIEAEVSPIVGTEQQSEELVNFLLREFENDPRRIWDTNMFGKPLCELIREGLHTKLAHIPEDARAKLSETLRRIINEGSGGLICIIL